MWADFDLPQIHQDLENITDLIHSLMREVPPVFDEPVLGYGANSFRHHKAYLFEAAFSRQDFDMCSDSALCCRQGAYDNQSGWASIKRLGRNEQNRTTTSLLVTTSRR